MHKPLSKAEVEALNSAVPVTPMTRAQKLERWAQVLEKAACVVMASNLEHYDEARRNQLIWTASPMAYAAADPVLSDGGLKGETVGDVKDFFELTNEELHAFSCDCGGSLTGKNMANRIRNIAAGPSIAARIGSAIFG